MPSTTSARSTSHGAQQAHGTRVQRSYITASVQPRFKHVTAKSPRMAQKLTGLIRRLPVHDRPVALHAAPPGGSGGGSGSVGTGGSGEGSQWPLGTGLFALLLFAGGAMGYIKKKSTKSAMAGGASGTIMLVAAILMRSPSTLKLGVYIACGTTLGLLVVMAKRFSSSKKFMPSGLLATLSAIWSGLYLTSGIMF